MKYEPKVELPELTKNDKLIFMKVAIESLLNNTDWNRLSNDVKTTELTLELKAELIRAKKKIDQIIKINGESNE